MPNTGNLSKYSSHLSLQRRSVSSRTFVCCRGVIDADQTRPGYNLRIQRSKHVNARILLWNVRLDHVAFFAKRVRFSTKVSDQHRNLHQMDQVGRFPIVVGALFLQLFKSVIAVLAAEIGNPLVIVGSGSTGSRRVLGSLIMVV
ncbi:hypothetical protein CLV75_1887 [Ruegeria conchae]|uniref:Uncharacterized protein n=1 Tax=Ruegeria conchae TaxID=981384 RepID=A0A497ZYZ6_9RHOB|nr:hypothetical protein CLV75_1887 [Ruegeria conchae]